MRRPATHFNAPPVQNIFLDTNARGARVSRGELTRDRELTRRHAYRAGHITRPRWIIAILSV